MYSAIVLVDRDWCMGFGDDGFPFRCPKHFDKIYKITRGHKCIVGRHSYEIKTFNNLLPISTELYVYSEYPETQLDVPVIHDLSFRIGAHDWNVNKGYEVFILGGYQMFMQHLFSIKKIYVTFADISLCEDETFKDKKPIYFPLGEWMEGNKFDVKISVDYDYEPDREREDKISQFRTYEKTSLRGNDSIVTDSSGTVLFSGADGDLPENPGKDSLIVGCGK